MFGSDFIMITCPFDFCLYVHSATDLISVLCPYFCSISIVPRASWFAWPEHLFCWIHLSMLAPRDVTPLLSLFQDKLGRAVCAGLFTGPRCGWTPRLSECALCHTCIYFIKKNSTRKFTLMYRQRLICLAFFLVYPYVLPAVFTLYTYMLLQLSSIFSGVWFLTA